MFRIIVQETDFDVSTETRALAEASKGIGGINTFVGLVRDINDASDVSSLFLEHYPGMTEKQIETILQEAASRWDVQSATVIHRVGELCPGEQIVFVGVASAHRGDAFDACEYIIDYLKTRATFWKKEKSEEGTRWLETRQSDIESADAWTKS
ncbi:MAG TPA: molybdopterin synthase catalytic subunit MoaE [Pseudomonadales bacterium]|jgi:molybdopterin synthase catalytic subunit|nr:molybdopterin synthase catalytic subunit MoaE [Gammaproteobacteria bacterium]MDP6027765.1 molybdopterin synthase catalytic subunit MoaE [Pseudomonadales bacterium]MDP6315419.1 molybdopterin synthase catalytic subunit MoaE [Pseudomonadales bacterium]MDP7315125.1 molybdopterin synthase catalytic subunit MoaE [Pseudomonadales bacterium]MDP7577436.1 molybdopterin synthase catalytic subunit MoaE [Pseudomonadales bacterium]|tara:strand:+ start:205 stop:663 length:459 start_codon:yes stop_codon:yes gene_type:complete